MGGSEWGLDAERGGGHRGDAKGEDGGATGGDGGGGVPGEYFVGERRTPGHDEKALWG